MTPFVWINILNIIVAVPFLVILIQLAIKDKLLSIIFFSLSLFSYLISSTMFLFNFPEKHAVSEWVAIFSITLVLCGLFARIRNSKPVFARFPVYLTFLPLTGLLFYPFVVESEIIKELLIFTYLGGGMLVAVLTVSINHYLYKNRVRLLVACFFFCNSYILQFFITKESGLLFEIISHILFLLGIIFATLGFKKLSELKNESFNSY